MKIVGSILAAAILVAAVTILIIHRRKKAKGNYIQINKKGININFGGVGNDKNLAFKGVSGESPTILTGTGRIENTYHLYLINQKSKEKYFLRFRREIGLGRAESNPGTEGFLSIPGDPRISAFHCSIYGKRGKIYIVDAGSTNHTMINERILKNPEILSDGDVIRMGNTRFEVRL